MLLQLCTSRCTHICILSNSPACIVRGDAAGSTICSFRMFQSPKFSTVVFTPEELKYWDRNITPRTPFTPTLVHLESEYETRIFCCVIPLKYLLPPIGRRTEPCAHRKRPLVSLLYRMQAPSVSMQVSVFWRLLLGALMSQLPLK